jgi:hypothetical protein
MCVNVKVDYNNTLQETNENNNDLSACRPLVATRQLRVFFVPISLGLFPDTIPSGLFRTSRAQPLS